MTYRISVASALRLERKKNRTMSKFLLLSLEVKILEKV
jgi:hypothetical protein